MKKLTLILSMMLALIGINANEAMYIVGTTPFGNWDPAVGEEMTLLADGTYTLDATLTTDATIYFIFTEAIGSWEAISPNRWDSGTPGSDMTVYPGVAFTPVKGDTGKSFKFTGTIGEKYTFTFNPTTKTAMVSGYVEPVTEFTYTVAGNSADIFGAEWNTGMTENDMTLDPADGLYKLVKNGVEIAGGFTLEYKVVENHSWGNNWGKTPNGQNQDYYFAESGTYNLTFIFDLENETVSLNAEKVGDGPEVNPLTGDLFMMGQVNGNGWAGNVGVPMVTEDDNIFTLTDAVIADADEGYGYFSFASKLGADANDWGFAAYRRGAMEDGEIVSDGVLAELAEWGVTNAFKALAGYYDVTVNLSDGTVLLTAKDAPEPEVDDVYIIGDVNDIGWSPTQGVQMTYDETNKIYTAEITTQEQGDLGVAYFGFTKKLADPESESEDIWQDIAEFRFGPESNGAFEMTEELLGVNCTLATNGSYESIAIPAGTWNVTVDLLNGTFKIDGTWPSDTVIPEPEVDDVYIIGDVNDIGWSPTQGVQMTYDETNKIYTAEITTQEQGDLGVAYFGFTKKLADPESESEDIWQDIAAYRFGPVSEGPFEMTEELLDVACTLATDGSYESIAIPAGTWTVTVDLVTNTFKINGEWPVDTVIPEPYTGDLYILGEANGNGWDPSVGVKMDYNAEQAVFTAEIDAMATNYDEALEANYSYFSFTKVLAENEGDWAAIAGQRIGAVSNGDFLVTDELLGQELSITNGENAFKVPSGYTYEITVSVDSMNVIINRVVWELGDVNHDHSLDVSDVTALISYILGNTPERFFTTEANVDGDEANAYDVGDVTALIAKILNN